MGKYFWWPSGVETIPDEDVMETFRNHFEPDILRTLPISVEFMIDIKDTVRSRGDTPTAAWLSTVFNTVCCAQSRLHELNLSWDHHIDNGLRNARHQHKKLAPSEHPSDMIDALEFERLIKVLVEEMESQKKKMKMEMDIIFAKLEYNINKGWNRWCESNAQGFARSRHHQYPPNPPTEKSSEETA
jgi:hypothetical protein